MTVGDAVNRGYNLMASTILALAGLAFGTVVFEEAEWADRIDDIGFLAIGAIAVAWYLIGNNRFKRSLVPIILSGLAVLVQILGLALEHDDTAAFGDNIGGMWLFLPLFVVLIVQYLRGQQHIAVPGPGHAATASTRVSK